MQLETIIASALLVLIATSIAVTLFRYLGMGSVLGLLVAGIIVGPYSPGPYVTTHVEDVRNITELGVVLLLFLIGLEMKPSRLWAMRREVLGMGSLQIILSGLAIGLYFSMYQAKWQTAMLIGFTFALSSTAFVLQLLQERGEIATPHGSTAFSVLLMQDIAIIPLLAVVPLMSATGPLAGAVPRWEQLLITIGLIVLLAVIGRYVIPFVLTHLARQRNKESFLLVVILAIFFAAWMMHFAGTSMALGAFIMGVSLSSCRYRLQIQALVEPFKGIMMALFFVAVGMSINLQALGEQFDVFAQHIVVIVAIKFTVLFLLVLTFGLSRLIASRVSLLLVQGGEFGFVIFGSAKVLQVIDDATFIHAVGIISVTMVATPILDRLGEFIYQRANKNKQRFDAKLRVAEKGGREKKVIIGGYGRVGHAVAMILQSSEVPFIVFDMDPARVEQGRRDGIHVYYGDIGDPDLLATIKATEAVLVVLTIDDTAAAEHAVSHIRNSFSDVPIIARARDLQAVTRLVEAGATHAYPEAVESSLRLGGMALEILNTPQENVDLLLEGVRSDNYKLVE